MSTPEPRWFMALAVEVGQVEIRRFAGDSTTSMDDLDLSMNIGPARVVYAFNKDIPIEEFQSVVQAMFQREDTSPMETYEDCIVGIFVGVPVTSMAPVVGEA